MSGASKIFVVTPSPYESDLRRERLADWGISEKFDVITISKFLSSKLNLKDELIKNFKVLKKSEVLLHLGFIYNRTHPNPTILNFENSYKWFSMLRGFSVDFTPLSNLFEFLPEDIVRTLNIFQFYFENENILDEHKAIFHLNQYCEEYFSSDEKIIFSDFTNLTGVQIDLIKTLNGKSISQVFVPDVFFSYQNNLDWVSWLGTEGERQDSTPKNLELTINTYKNGQLAHLLNEKIVSEKFNKIVLATSESEYVEHNLNVGQFYFKDNLDVLKIVREKIFNELDFGKDIASLKKYLENEIQKVVKSKTQIIFEYYYKIKIHQLILSHLNLIEALTNSNPVLGPLMIEILKLVNKLDSPRAHFIPLIQNKEYEVTEIKKFNIVNGQKGLICFDSDYVQNLSNNELPFILLQKLATIGPIKNKQFEMAQLLYNLSHCEDGQIQLFIPEDYKETSPFLSTFLSDPLWKTAVVKPCHENIFNKKDVSDPLDYLIDEKLAKTYLENKNYHGLSSLETYDECPRKYYFSYIQKIDQRFETGNLLLPTHLGELEHLVVAKCCEEKLTSLNDKKIFSTAEVVIKKYLSEKKINLNKVEYFKSLNEIFLFSRNALSYLAVLLEPASKYNLLFEYSVSLQLGRDIILKGRVDCLIEYDNDFYVLDFKRKKSATKSEFINLKDIQIGPYILALENELHKKVKGFGYVIMGEEDQSLWAFQDSKATQENQIVKIETLKIDSQEYRDKLTDKLTTLITKLKNETHFIPTPSDEACRFCVLKAVCKKGIK